MFGCKFSDIKFLDLNNGLFIKKERKNNRLIKKFWVGGGI